MAVQCVPLDFRQSYGPNWPKNGRAARLSLVSLFATNSNCLARVKVENMHNVICVDTKTSNVLTWVALLHLSLLYALMQHLFVLTFTLMPKIFIDKLGYMEDFWNIQSDFYSYLQVHVQSVDCSLLPQKYSFGKRVSC